MSFFIADAYAAAGAPAAPNIFGSLMPLLLIFGAFYFLMIRPQMKREKQRKQMIAAIAKGDEVVTSGGIAGKVIHIDDHFLDVEIATDVVIKLSRNAIANVLPKGSLKGKVKEKAKK